tara:strand:- start:2851 stop:3024 length:174 start_codon:yes stop_codon:yes gene_type:complete
MKNKNSQSDSEIEIIEKEICRLQSKLYTAINVLDSTKINRLSMQIAILEYIKLQISV